MRAWIRSRVEPSRRTIVLAIGDAAAIGLFVWLGEIRHGGTVAAGAETLAQFGLGWLIAAVGTGVYAAGAVDSPTRAVTLGVTTWIVAALLGQLVRLLATPGSLVQPSFVLVSIAVGGLFIGSWRAVAGRLVGD